MIADLVEQQTTTTGTGAYTVSGSVTGRQTFTAALANNDVVPYVVTDDAGNFECGIGTWTEGTTQLARTEVMTSSNAGAAVNWAAGTKRIYVSPIAASLPLTAGRNASSAGAAPGLNDDSLLGYKIGSTWQQSSGIGAPALYVCFDSTLAAARWVTIPLPNAQGTTAFPGYVEINAPWTNYGGLTIGGGRDTDNATYWDYAEAAIAAFFAKTTDATPTNLQNTVALPYASYQNSFYVESASAATLTGTVQAINTANGDIKTWTVSAVIKTTSGGSTTIVAGSAPTSSYNDASLASAAIAIVAVSNEVSVEATGIAATTIIWGASLQFGTVLHNV